MIGLGTWGCRVDTMFFKGPAEIKVFEENGQYAFDLNVPGVEIPDITIISVEEDGDTLNAVVQTSLLPNKDIDLCVTFEDDIVTGFLKIPFIGKVKLKDGHRIA